MRVPRPIRRITDPLLERVPVPVLGGANRGRWWNLASAGGYATGRRARSQMRALAALIRPGELVWDIGAHHGYVTLCAAGRAGRSGAVHAFEPAARDRRLLLRHLRWNNVEVHPYALSSFDGSAAFGGAMEILPALARLLIAVHSRETYRDCVALLERADYEVVDSARIPHRRTGVWCGDPDIFAIGPAYSDRGRDRSVLRECGFYGGPPTR